MTNILLFSHILLLFHSPKRSWQSWKKFAKYEKLVKYLSYSTLYRAITTTFIVDFITHSTDLYFLHRFDENAFWCLLSKQICLYIRFEICSKLTIKMIERRHWSHSDVFIANFKHISHFFLMVLLLLWTGICLLSKFKFFV